MTYGIKKQKTFATNNVGCAINLCTKILDIAIKELNLPKHQQILKYGPTVNSTFLLKAEQNNGG